ncbi:MAG: helix-turn-helix transcriptional regulator [Acidobacteriota bacterium]|nr:helix-turn-helix transcriptional regulator [Acidobacteriota bacterium]
MGLNILTVPEENSCGCVNRREPDEHGCLCSTTGLVRIIGRKYALRLLFLIGAREGVRFTEIMSAIGEPSTSTLTIRLTELEQTGLLRRKEFPEMPPRVEYSLTKKGHELRKSLFHLSKFATRK